MIRERITMNWRLREEKGFTQKKTNQRNSIEAASFIVELVQIVVSLHVVGRVYLLRVLLG